MKKIRVLFVFSGTPHYYNLVLSRLNLIENIEVFLLAPLDQSSAVGSGVFQTEKGANFPIHRLPEIPYLKKFTTFEGLAELLEKVSPDIVVVTQAHLDVFALSPELKRLRKKIGFKVLLKTIPFMLPTFEETLKIGRGSPFIRKFKQWIWASFERYKFSRIATGHVNYIEDAKRVFGSYGVGSDRIFITGNSPDTDLLFASRERVEKEGYQRNPNRLIHVGRLADWKRVDLLIRATARLKPRFPNLETVIVGDGPQRKEWEALAMELGISASVKFVGSIYEPDALARAFMEAGIYVLAGMGGLSINDAMVFGLPVVCSVCDGTEKELVFEGRNGSYFEAGDAISLSEKIEKILESPARLKEMGETSTRIIRENVNIQTVLRGYEKAFQFALKAPR